MNSITSKYNWYKTVESLIGKDVDVCKKIQSDLFEIISIYGASPRQISLDDEVIITASWTSINNQKVVRVYWEFVGDKIIMNFVSLDNNIGDNQENVNVEQVVNKLKWLGRKIQTEDDLRNRECPYPLDIPPL